MAAAVEDIYVSLEECYCKICNLSVPLVYLSVHYASNTHRTMNELCYLINENCTKHIDIQDVEHFGVDKTFYCEVCCKAVLNDNKIVHVKTNAHLRSVEKCKIAAEFLKNYKNGDKNDDKCDEDVVAGEVSGYKNAQRNEAHDDNDGAVGEVLPVDGIDVNVEANNEDAGDGDHIGDEGDADNMDDESNNEDGDNNVDVNDGGIAGDNARAVIDFQSYLKTMVESYIEVNGNALMDNNSVVVVTPKASVAKIDTDTFHNTAYCEKCYNYIARERNLKRSTSRNYGIVNELVYTWKYCLLCKKNYSDYSHFCYTCKIYYRDLDDDDHYSSEEHITFAKFQEWMRRNAYESSSDEPYENNRGGRDADIESGDCFDVDSITSETYDNYCGQFWVKGRELQCRVCNVMLPYTDQNMKEHVEGSKHSDRLTNLLEYHSIFETTDIIYYCTRCQVYESNFMDHIQSNNTHISLVNKYGSVDKNKLIKFVHKINANTYEANYYKKLYEALLHQNKIEKDQNKFYCKPCDATMTRISEIHHMFGVTHKENIEK